MLRIDDLCRYLESFAPRALGADWDNVGLLVGDRTRPIERVMTCLTITPSTAAEAVREGAGLIVTHHPMPFQPLKRLTTDNTVGRLLLELIEARIAVHSPHTAFDSAAEGINQGLAEGVGLVDIQPLEAPADPSLPGGGGRWGRLANEVSAANLAAALKAFLQLSTLQIVGRDDAPVQRVAIGCGSAGSFLEAAAKRGCDCFITGETNFHTCLEAEARGISLLLPGHYASERFGVERLAKKLAVAFPALTVWAARDERDPLRYL